MSDELSNLYAKNNINIASMKKTNEANADVRFVLSKDIVVENDDERVIDYVIRDVNVAGIDKSYIHNNILNMTMFNTQKEALSYANYLKLVDRVVTAAEKVNIADNNYHADYQNEDERKYIINYNERNGSISYDFSYTILAGFTDFRLCFRTQTIAENFINSFRSELIQINKYRVEYLKNRNHNLA